MAQHPSALVIGHRGASGYRPEHTRAAYELAYALGADAVEPDIVATRDGVLVIRHENEISSTTDVAQHPEFADRRTTKEIDGQQVIGWFTEDFTWAELATLRARERLGELRSLSRSFDGCYPILRLSELFEIADAAALRAERPIGIVAEIKHPTYFAGLGLPLDELFAAELADSGWEQDALIVECFEQSALADVRRRGVASESVYLIEASGAPADRVARDGSAAVGYARDIAPAGLASIAAGEGDKKVHGVSVNARLLVQGGNTDESDAGGGPAMPVLLEPAPVVADAHAVGLGVFCWTLRAENRFLAEPFRSGDGEAAIGDWRGQFEFVLGLGVDGVFADQPDLAVAARDESG
ncbi:glycerophosphodiester phosphodiesterase family protein [Microbacterium sp. STN6]|uniref:glycerophosphodiester phosphodiesterase family protein n=1 Tax=Microbacterium sp. STN6 TaxID=2995588 RepID=UPI002260C303|nr:glycerophosphodiester phosphodiesterase family protein [Microbacterium sp. STN6]MCX7523283.1 glycerophosphodiester phosphodiesterase family protein [Microbacterium sp. STN6]